LFEYDITGGRYEETRFAASGSGSMHAGTVVKINYREGMGRDDTVDLAISALFEAADEDSATGGPDLVRGIFPVIATITAGGFVRLEDDEIAERFRALIGQLESREGSARLPETTDERGDDAS
jgi:proteasome beta subunit